MCHLRNQGRISVLLYPNCQCWRVILDQVLVSAQVKCYIYGLAQVCGNSSALAIELL